MKFISSVNIESLRTNDATNWRPSHFNDTKFKSVVHAKGDAAYVRKEREKRRGEVVILLVIRDRSCSEGKEVWQCNVA